MLPALKGEKTYHRRMLGLAQSAKSVELQWTYHGAVVESVPIGARTYEEWLARLPVRMGPMEPLSVKCHMPHHQVRLQRSGGTTSEIEICFTCNSIRIPRDTARKLPSDWRGSFVKLFGDEGIPLDPPGMDVVRRNFAKLPAELQTGLLRSDASERLKELLKMDEYPGSVYAQAKAAGVDYRRLLGEAERKEDADSLRALVEAGDKAGLMGEAGETEAEVFLLLMQVWGDAIFAEALSAQGEPRRKRVLELIDHAWAEPRWELYPETGKMKGDE